MKFKLCQVSNTVLNPRAFNEQEDCHYAIWRNKKDDGYWKTEHYWEIPLWMAEVCYTLPSDVHVEKEIWTNKSQDKLKADYIYCLSVTNVCMDIVIEAIRDNADVLFYLGGYVDPSNFDEFDNVEWFDTIEDFAHGCGYEYKQGLDYSLFKGEHTIPRLTLSEGCLHNCKFCTIPHKLKARDSKNIWQQLTAFKDLRFKLVYLDDKTFGQCSNHKHIEFIAAALRAFNPGFEGFIVQTSCAQVVRTPHIFNDPDIRIVELGIETYNNEILTAMNKPSSTTMIDKAVYGLHSRDKKIIPNLMLGLLGETWETYGRTLRWLFTNRRKFYAININVLTIYHDTPLQQELGIRPNDGDTSENCGNRSYWTEEEESAFNCMSLAFYKIGKEIAEGNYDTAKSIS